MSIDKPKSNSVITTELVMAGDKTAGIKFKVKEAGETYLELARCHDKILDRAIIHGLVQKVSDAAALSRDPKTGKSASAADKLAAMVKVVEHLTSGTEEWNLKREGGGGPGMETQWLVRALCEVYPQKTPEAIGKWVKARTLAERVALMAQENIKAKVEGYKAEQSEGVDAEALLSGLDQMDESGEEPKA